MTDRATSLRVARVTAWDDVRITSHLAFDHDRVFWLDLDGQLNAGAPGGARTWRVPMPGAAPRNALQAIRLSIVEDDLVANHRDDTVRVSRTDGAQRWHATTSNVAADEGSSVIAGESLVCGALERLGGPFSLATVALATGAVERRGERETLERYVFAHGELALGLGGSARVAHGVRIADGSTVWTAELARPSRLPSVPVGAAGPRPGVNGATVIFDVAGYGLVAIDGASGELHWERAFEGFGRGDVVVHDGRAHVLTSSFHVAIDPATGDILAEHRFGNELNALGIALVSRPVVWGRYLFAADSAGIAFAYDPEQRHLAWRVDVGARTARPPQVAFDRLWLKDDGGRVHVFELAP